MQGEGGVLLYDTIQIGTIGRWRLGRGEDEAASFSATGCHIQAFWTSAGVARLCARPHADGKPKLWFVEGDVQELTADRVVLVNISILEGADSNG
jgi:hypothetical protein